MNIDPLILMCGIVCVWPLLFAAVGFWVGRSRIRLRSPFEKSDETIKGRAESAGYARRP